MISLVTAPPGGGKSFYAVRAVAQALDAGKLVAGNVELREGWARTINRRNYARWLRPIKHRRWEADAESRFFFSEDLSELFALRLRGEREGRGLMVLDEAHNWMNARSWSAKDRDEIVRFFTQHRKLGWDVLLIAQDAEMLDKQVRRNFEYHVHLRNLRKARFAGLPLSPVNLFLAITTWHAATRVVVKREVFPLSWRKRLYNTNATFGGLVGDAAASGLWLPCPPSERQPAPRPGAAAPDAALPADSLPDQRAWDAEQGAPLEVDSFDPADLDPSTR
jgi:hypothetical protein